ncbi:MAG: toll/interleukin-1 receptor domain-containing protein [Clostridia bacterium]|nr:toll/interleukin-1 receptor domain-containing protein [Clostridia bacterium]
MATHLTKEEVVNGEFLFVSYKHENKELVADAIESLLAEGIRLWYDADLVVGNKWSSVAEGLIRHENCRGVIFFNSVASFMSDPVYKERSFAIEKQKACESTDRPFYVFPVNIGKPSTMQLLKEIFAALPESDAEAERVFPIRYLQTIVELFDSDVIYCYADPADTEGYKKVLCDNVTKALPSVVDKAAMQKKTQAAVGGIAPASIPVGICKLSPTSDLPAYYLTKDQRVEHQNATYLVQDGKAYSTKRILWRRLYEEKDMAVLLSEEVVDVRNGGKELNEWLQTVFAPLAFSDAERAVICELRLLCEKDIQKTNDPERFVFPLSPDATESHFWISDISMGALQKVVKKNGTVYAGGYNFRTKKSGVRPVICVPKAFLENN